jgi:hypothetical protein
MPQVLQRIEELAASADILGDVDQLPVAMHVPAICGVELPGAHAGRRRELQTRLP